MGLHFILSDNGNYNFDVKVKRCKIVGFVNDVIDCDCLECVFCFRIKEKKKEYNQSDRAPSLFLVTA